MKEYIEAIDRLPLLVKLLLAIFVDVIWHIYRILYALIENDMTALIVAIVLVVLVPVSVICDVVMILLTGTVWRYRSAA